MNVKKLFVVASFVALIAFFYTRSSKDVSCSLGRGYEPSFASDKGVEEFSLDEGRNLLSNPIIFLERVLKGRKPVVFRDAMREDGRWKAMDEWNDVYLNKTIGHLKVTIESSKGDEFGDLASDWGFKEMNVSDFVRQYLNPLNNGKRHIYFNSIVPKELQQGIDIPSFVPCLRMKVAPYYRLTNMWWGGGGEYSLLHNDLQDNLVHVVSGFKRFHLFSPNDAPFLYERLDVNRTETRVCSVDPERVDLNQYPLYLNANAMQVTLRPGDILYLPALWFHAVRSYCRSIMVNIWFDFWDYSANGLERVYKTPTHKLFEELKTHKMLCKEF